MTQIDGMCVLQAKELAEVLRALRPDRGNHYAPRSVKARGEAKYQQWRDTIEAVARRLNAETPGGFDMIAFIVACQAK